mmetsp:Transcript_32067/g.96551  ORF Transcript_32067/g.96551 Transcript_32067/m.96551 type:complete len:363 (+) Transcript_32067:658-1746(+)
MESRTRLYVMHLSPHPVRRFSCCSVQPIATPAQHPSQRKRQRHRPPVQQRSQRNVPSVSPHRFLHTAPLIVRQHFQLLSLHVSQRHSPHHFQHRRLQRFLHRFPQMCQRVSQRRAPRKVQLSCLLPRQPQYLRCRRQPIRPRPPVRHHQGHRRRHRHWYLRLSQRRRRATHRRPIHLLHQLHPRLKCLPLRPLQFRVQRQRTPRHRPRQCHQPRLLRNSHRLVRRLHLRLHRRQSRLWPQLHCQPPLQQERHLPHQRQAPQQHLPSIQHRRPQLARPPDRRSVPLLGLRSRQPTHQQRHQRASQQSPRRTPSSKASVCLTASFQSTCSLLPSAGVPLLKMRSTPPVSRRFSRPATRPLVQQK